MSHTEAIVELLGMLGSQPRLLIVMGLVLVAALIDWRSMRIPNWLTGGGMLLGLLLSVAAPSSVHTGLAFALGGLALGLALMLPLYLLGVMGAGDVKLMAMVGTYLGVPYTLHAVLFVFVTGGVLAVATVIWRGVWGPVLRNLRHILVSLRMAPATAWRAPSGLASLPSVGKLPYGVSICAGTLIYVLAHQLGYV